DPDDDPLVYSASNLPPGATLDWVQGILTWTPNYFEAGAYPGIVVSAGDGLKTASWTFAITVGNTPQRPVLVPLHSQSGREGTVLRFGLAANDIDGEALTYSAVSGLPDGATFDPRTAAFEWTPTYEQAGDYTIRFAVQSASGLSDATDVQV